MSDLKADKSSKKRRKEEAADGDSKSAKKPKIDSDWPRISTAPIPLPPPITNGASAKAPNKSSEKPKKVKSSKPTAPKPTLPKATATLLPLPIHTITKAQSPPSTEPPTDSNPKPNPKEKRKEKREKKKRKDDVPVSQIEESGVSPEAEAGAESQRSNKPKKATFQTRPSPRPTITEPEEDATKYPLLTFPKDTQETGMEFLHVTMPLLLPPIAMKYPLQGAIANGLAPMEMAYVPQFKGVVLAFDNIQPSEGENATSKSIEQYCQSQLPVDFDVLTFCPSQGVWLEGFVTTQSDTHINLQVLNIFTARIERKNIPRAWKFVLNQESAQNAQDGSSEQERFAPKQRYKSLSGTWHDGDGNPIGTRLIFRSIDFDTPSSSQREKALITIEGSLLSDEEKREIFEKRT